MPRKPDTPCSKCGRLLVSGPGSLPVEKRKCRPCRAVARAETTVSANCRGCGVDFTVLAATRKPSWGPPTVCSSACALALATSANRAPRPCIICDTDVIKPGVPMCSSCAGERERERLQRKNRARRAHLRKVASEPYTVAEIAERDRFGCQLCGDPVDMTLRAPHPFSPSIDHVMPLAAGGDDTRANVQLAHRTCNIRKGARVSPSIVLEVLA